MELSKHKIRHYINMRNQLIKIIFAGVISIISCLVSLAQQWTPIPFIKQETRDAGITLGGEEGQWPQTIVFEPINGSYALYGTDVGGLFRSTDEGKTWEPSNIGYSPRGVAFFAIDPNNVERVIAVGGMQHGNKNNGASLSKDGGITWESTHRMFNKDYKHYKDAVAYDATSYNAEKGFSTIAYWSCPPSAEPTGEVLFKTTDGGLSWFVVNSDHTYGNKHVKISPSTGSVFIFGDGNLYRSQDGGVSFEKIISGWVYSMETVYTYPDTLFLMKSDGMYQSTDDGDSWVHTGTAYVMNNPQRLRISPVNPDHMIHWRDKSRYNWPRFYTTDGGNTWHESEIPRGDKYFFNWRQARQGAFSYHPKKENVILSVGNDNVTKSTDSGATFHWSNSGVNNFCPSGIHPLNPFNHRLLYIGGRDKAGAYSKDGGYSWINAKAIELSYSGGHAACGYAMTEEILVGVGLDRDVDEKWKICVSNNGGVCFNNTGIEFEGIRTACPDITDPAKVYLGAFRSTDYGQSWEKMSGVEGVFSYNPTGKNELYGSYGSIVVRSFDHGISWENVVDVGAEIEDIAIDHEMKKLYIAAGKDLYICDTEGNDLENITMQTPEDQFGHYEIESVAVDPNNPRIAYIANSSSYLMDNNIVRTTDHGGSWEIITRNTRFPNPQYGKDGGRMPVYVRVCHTTSEAYVGGGCFGLWKIGPPPGTNPVVRISSPLNQSEIIKTDSLAIEVVIFNDKEKIEKLDLFINDQEIYEFFSEPYRFNWNPRDAGKYEIYARATDTSGNSFNSLPVEVKVLPSALPEASISSPSAGAEFEYFSDIEIVVSANDPDGSIEVVEFYMDSVYLEKDTVSPFSFSLVDLDEGEHTLIASATDNTNQTVFTLPVTIIIKEQVYSFFYKEDFSDGVAQGWNPLSGDWNVENNTYRKTGADGIEISILNDYRFRDYRYTLKANPDLSNYFGIIFNYQDDNNYYYLMLDAYPAMVLFYKVLEGEESLVSQEYYSGGGAGNWLEIEVLNEENNSSVFVGGNPIFFEIPCYELDSGRIGLYTRNNSVWFDDIEVAAKEMYFINGFDSPSAIRNEVTVFPNPLGNEDLTIQTPWKNSDIQVCVYNLDGQEIFSKTFHEYKIHLPADLFIKQGVYIMRLYSREEVFYQKVMKQY